MKKEQTTVAEAKKETCQEPKKWNIIKALNWVLYQAKDSKLSAEFWKACAKPLAYLEKKLQLTKVQIVFLAMMVECGEPISWRGFAKYLNCSRLSVMVYSEEFEELLTKCWIERRRVYEQNRHWQGFGLVHGVVTALRRNVPFVPEKMGGLEIQEFVDKLECHFDKSFLAHEEEFNEFEEWAMNFCKLNPHLPLCQKVLQFEDIHVQSLLLLLVYDYTQAAGSEDEGITFFQINNYYPLDFESNYMRKRLKDNSHPLITEGLVEQKCEDGLADLEKYMLTSKCKEDLLCGYTPHIVQRPSANNRFLKNHSNIIEKEMYYNPDEQEQIERLKRLLEQKNFSSVQERLQQIGMRKGFACLFYGAPGTGKTESVLQIARQTGRDIMQVDIAGMRDKYVGESEKNIKAVFQNYRELCKKSEVMPILFFNEADALINKRTERIEHSVDKMDNAMQNIILQEIEDLEGILIATTNLTNNLDHAFERRFLFKIEFHKPSTEIKVKLWNSMIKDLTKDEAQHLANCYDFSGGQIENIARKQTVDYILSGKHASLEDIESFCESEVLNHKSGKKIGFV